MTTKPAGPTITKWLPKSLFADPGTMWYINAAGITLITEVGLHGNDYGIAFPAASQAARSDIGLLSKSITYHLVTAGGTYQPTSTTANSLLHNSYPIIAIESMLIWPKSKAEVTTIIDQALALSGSPPAVFATWYAAVTNWPYTTPTP